MDPIGQALEQASEEARRLRSESHLTLGRLISYLEFSEPNLAVANLHNPHSYRGYYTDLAFEWGSGYTFAKYLLHNCKHLLGQHFEGYRGGSYRMGMQTPLWIANYGDCGHPLMSLDGRNVSLGSNKFG
jgi:hypothetical protein